MSQLHAKIHHRFDGFTLDLDITAGAGVTALFGRSGAGKTSVVNAIAGLLRPDTAQIRFGDTMLSDSAKGFHLPPHKRGFGYVFQDARLFPHMNVRKNLNYGARYTSRPAVISEADVIDLLGLSTLLDRMPASLSGGERQRTALGRALLAQPRMLLMDEPLAALDGPRKQDILPYLEHLKSAVGIPILYVSHALDEIARLADSMVLLKSGAVAAQGPVFDVMADAAAVPLLGVREAGAVLEATVTGHDDDGLSQLKVAAGMLELPGVAAPIGATVRIRVLAQDVILAREAPTGLSSVNILPVRVTGVHPGGGPGAAITLDAAGQRLLARVTARAVADLDLKPDVDAFAILKATTVAPGSIGR